MDGSQAPQTNPPIKWLRFAKNPPIATYSNVTGGSGWEVFKVRTDPLTLSALLGSFVSHHQFTVTPYSPTTLWTVQAHMGAKWDTFSGVDYSICPCPNCDGGALVRIQSLLMRKLPYRVVHAP